jgi:acyl-CoA thioesterase I
MSLYRIVCGHALLIILACSSCVQFDGLPQGGDELGAKVSRKAAPVVYVALGDSTGSGFGSRNGGYVERLFARIQQEYPGSRLTNLSKVGATTTDVLREQVNLSLDARPTLITVGIGLNDLIQGIKAEEFSRNYEEIIVRLKQRARVPIIIMNIPDLSLAPAMPPYMRADMRQRILLFNEQIEGLATRHNLLVVDLYGMNLDLSSHPEFFSADGIHPSDAGYEFWAGLLWPTVEKALSKQPQ